VKRRGEKRKEEKGKRSRKGTFSDLAGADHHSHPSAAEYNSPGANSTGKGGKKRGREGRKRKQA